MSPRASCSRRRSPYATGSRLLRIRRAPRLRPRPHKVRRPTSSSVAVHALAAAGGGKQLPPPSLNLIAASELIGLAEPRPARNCLQATVAVVRTAGVLVAVVVPVLASDGRCPGTTGGSRRTR